MTKSESKVQPVTGEGATALESAKRVRGRLTPKIMTKFPHATPGDYFRAIASTSDAEIIDPIVEAILPDGSSGPDSTD